MKKEIYLDNAATTMIRPEVAKAMIENLEKAYGNPSSIYKIARENKNILEDNREKVTADQKSWQWCKPPFLGDRYY